MNKTPSPKVTARGPVDHEVRDQIVTAATEHFSRYGYEKTTVSDLAKAIGFSKAYIYKFFESKQAIGEAICANCLRQIETEVRAAVDEAERPPEKLRRMFKALVESSLRLFFQDRKLYEIAASAATDPSASVLASIAASDCAAEKLVSIRWICAILCRPDVCVLARYKAGCVRPRTGTGKKSAARG